MGFEEENNWEKSNRAVKEKLDNFTPDDEPPTLAVALKNYGEQQMQDKEKNNNKSRADLEKNELYAAFERLNKAHGYRKE